MRWFSRAVLYTAVWAVVAEIVFEGDLLILVWHESGWRAAREAITIRHLGDLLLLIGVGPLPFIPLIVLFGLLHVALLAVADRRHQQARSERIRRSLKIGLCLGLCQLVGSVFLRGSLAIWWRTMLGYGLSGLVASVCGGYVLGRYWYSNDG